MRYLMIIFALLSTAAFKGNPDRLRDKKSCKAQIEELAAVAHSDFRTYMNYSRVLRQRILENPGPTHRTFSRAALAKLLLLKVGATDGATNGCMDSMAPLLTDEVMVIAPWYEQADRGALGVPALRLAIQGRDTLPLSVGQRILATHALSLTGVIPTDEMIEEINREIASEPNQDVRFEKIMTLAAYAQRNKDALRDVRTILLETTDCAFAEAVAFSLPGEDLRYKLFHSLSGPAGSRPQNIRVWLRERRYTGCR